MTRDEVVSLGRQADLNLADEAAEAIRRATAGNLRQCILYLVRLDRRASAAGQRLVALDWVAAVETEITRSKLRAARGGRNLAAVK